MEIQKTKRLEYIDFLKMIGFCGLILAHVQPPRMIMYLRNFDVPLLIMLSAFLAENSEKKHRTDSRKYILKRFKRIILPPWVFITFFFVASYAVNVRWSVNLILKTFLFQRDSLGYVWIFWIYFMMACITPLIAKIKLDIKTVLMIGGVYILYEYCYYKGVFADCRVIDYTFYYLVPYGVITFLGYHYGKLTLKKKIIIQIISIFIWGGWVCWSYLHVGECVDISLYKYPPRIYYLSYGVMITNLLMLIFKDRDFYLFRNIVVLFISSHTMWIYLWHIPILLVWYKLFPCMSWVWGFIGIIIIASIIVLIQNYILDKIERKIPLKIWNIFRG